jgi:hypothetical protein
MAGTTSNYFDLTSTNLPYKTQRKSSIQVSYPTSIDNVESTSGTFYLSNARTLPNFTYTNSMDSAYISGSAVQGFVTAIKVKVSATKTYTQSLVIKHMSMTGNAFYVVIPLYTKKDSKTSLSTLLKDGKGKLNLNSDIHNPNSDTSIYHSKATIGTSSSADIFVFNKPIDVNSYGVENKELTITSVAPDEVVTSTSKIEEDMDCQSGEEIETITKTDTNQNYIYFVMFFVDIFIIVLAYAILTMVSKYSKYLVLYMSSLVGLIMFIVLLAYIDKGKTEAKKISDPVLKYEAQTKYNTHIAVSANLFIACSIAFIMAVFGDELKAFATTPSSSVIATVASLASSVTGTPGAPKIKPRWI